MLQAAKGTGMGSQFCKTQRATSKQEPPPGLVIHPTGQLQGQNKAKATSLTVNTGALPHPSLQLDVSQKAAGCGTLEPEQRNPWVPCLSLHSECHQAI